MWAKIRKWLADRIAPKAADAVRTLEDAARKAEEKSVTEVAIRVPGVPMRIVRFLLVLTLLGICAGGYCLYWRSRPEKPAPSLTPVTTQGGGTVYQGEQVPEVTKAARRGKARPKVTVRPVVTTPAEELPPEERAKTPAIPPAAGPDNVVRPPELATTAVVPPSRGETYVRAYVLPSGAVQAYQDPQREPFWGWEWKRIEVEGRYGLIGNTAVRGTGRWLPLRMGDVHAGLEGSVATERDAVVRGEGMLMIRYEPFRKSYR